MSKKSQNLFEIIDLNTRNIDKEAVEKIYDMLSVKSTRVALDLSKVTTCVSEFFELFRKFQDKKLTLVNVDSKILATIYMTGYDKFVRVFEDTLSLTSDKHEIINRRFSLV